MAYDFSYRSEIIVCKEEYTFKQQQIYLRQMLFKKSMINRIANFAES